MKNDSCPKCKQPFIAVEYWYDSPERYDGISEYACITTEGCGYRVGRWTGQELKEGYIEPQYGRGGIPVRNTE